MPDALARYLPGAIAFALALTCAACAVGGVFLIAQLLASIVEGGTP